MGGDSAEGPGASGKRPAGPRDRRANHRAAVEIPAVLQVGSREVACTVRDLGTRGIALATRERLAPGTVVRVTFRLPTADQSLEITGAVVRSAGGREARTVGLEFVELGADAVRELESFVASNRTDWPFSGRRDDESDAARGDAEDSAASLEGLFQRAVEDVAAKDEQQPGLLDRWLRRGKD